jgi:hypothetical protein
MFGTLAVILLLLWLAMHGNEPELSTQYGRRRGNGAADSVNGTAVLANLFEQAGHRVTSITKLSDRLEKFDTIVWAPDRFEPPSAEVRQFLDSWLAGNTHRTLVYIGRDYDAAPQYWETMLAGVDEREYDEYVRRHAQAQSRFAARRAALPHDEPAEWFRLLSTLPARKIPDLDGLWAEGVNASATDITLAARLDIPEPNDDIALDTVFPGSIANAEVDILLQSENDILAHRYRVPAWQESQVIVVANGSFTLNMGLVNKEHRKLAAALVAECGGPGSVAFLESGPEEVPIERLRTSNHSDHALRIFMIWPISFIFIHFVALGIIYCVARSPIFGRARTLPAESRSDFGQHVAALGSLLQRTRDQFFAESRIRQYQTHSKRKSGQTHRLPAGSPPVKTIATNEAAASQTAMESKPTS